MSFAPPALSPSTRFVLGLVVVVQCVGLVLSAARLPTSVGAYLFLVQGWAEPSAQLLERGATLVAVLGSLGALMLGRPGARLASAAVASAWVALLAFFDTYNGGAPFTALAVPAHAARIAAPLALALFDRPGVARWVLRVGVASTFAVHGYEALRLHPFFVDYLLAADMRLLGLGISQAQAELVLRVIGAMDVAVALAVASGRDSRRVLAWAAVWGVVTALSRMVQGSWGALHLTLERAANGGLPAVLLLAAAAAPRALTMGRRARWASGSAALGLVAALAVPAAAHAQALSGSGPGHLRVVWTVDPAHRATVAWSTAAQGGTHEVYFDTAPRGGKPADYAQKVVATNGVYVNGGAAYHHAQLGGLTPSTTYYFVVVSNGVALPERHFVSAPADDRAFRLLSGGDSRTGITERQKMNQLMARMLTDDPGIVALAHGGDYVGTADDWSEWTSWLTDHALTTTAAGRVLPVIPTRGNHEGGGVMYNQVFGFPGGTSVDYYTAQLGANVSLIILDTNVSIGGDQRTWLQGQLQAAQASRWIVPGYHAPAFPAVKTPSGARQFWVPLFEQYNADLALESDGHALKRTQPIRGEKQDATGVVYVGEGGLGVSQRAVVSQWYLQSPGMATSAHHVQLLSFSPEKLVYEARGMTGTVLDRWERAPRRAGTPVAAPAAPRLAEASARNATTVDVTFSEDMDAASVRTPAMYTLSAGARVLDAAVVSARKVALTTSALTPGAQYTLSVGAVKSAVGTTLGGTAQLGFTVAQAGTTPEPTPPGTTPPATPGDTTTPPSQDTADGSGVTPPVAAAQGCAADGSSTVVPALAVLALGAAAARRRRRRQAQRVDVRAR